MAVLGLLITSCGSVHVPTGNASPARISSPGPASSGRVASAPAAPSPCTAVQVPHTFPVSPATSRNLVIAKLRGSDQTLIRDVTDIDHPSTVANVEVPDWMGDWWRNPSFVSPSTIAYLAGAQSSLVRLPLSGSGAETVAALCRPQSIPKFAWSPDGQSFTYIVDPQDSASAFQWHLVSGGVDRLVGTAPLWCYCGEGTEEMSLGVDFSPDGRFIWLVENVLKGSDLQVRRLDGSLVGAEIRGDQRYPNPPTHGVWSGMDLFFRDKQGVERWTNGDIRPFLPGVAWVHPKSSQDGRQIVYGVRGSDGFSRVSVVDLASGRARQLSGEPRTSPFFLSPRYVWYRGERLCRTTGETGPCLTTTLSGMSYIYDLQTGTESESIIADIADVWPHGA
jgi:hypothetical protein